MANRAESCIASKNSLGNRLFAEAGGSDDIRMSSFEIALATASASAVAIAINAPTRSVDIDSAGFSVGMIRICRNRPLNRIQNLSGARLTYPPPLTGGDSKKESARQSNF